MLTRKFLNGRFCRSIRRRKRPGDVPANASDLQTHEEIGLERDRQQLRSEQEETKSFRSSRQGRWLVLGMVGALSVALVVIAFVALRSGAKEVAISTSGAVTALAVYLLRFYAG